MSKQMKVPDTVYERADEMADEMDTSKKEAVRMMCRSDTGYDV